MYLENIKDIETKKGFIAQILMISRIYNKTKGYIGIFDNLFGLFGFGNGNICSIFLKKSINELSNNDKDIEYELNEISISLDNYIEHIINTDNEIVNLNNEDITINMIEKVWQKYSKNIENAEISVKKMIYFELYGFAVSLDINLDSYFKLLKNKLNMNKNIYKEIENIIQRNASIYKSISDIINIG